MADNNSIDVAAGVSNLDRTFNASVGEPGVAPDAGRYVNATAGAEIQIIQDAEQALAQHDDRWRRLSDRLSHRPEAAPSLDLDGGSRRSIAREYTEHRRQWDVQRETIEAGAIGTAADVRANGTTLTHAFSTASENENATRDVAPEPSERALAPETAHRREFSITASGVSRSHDR